MEAVAEVFAEALKDGGTSFDSLYVNVNGESGYFDRSLNVYGRAGEPCPRCGTPIRRDPFMNRSSYTARPASRDRATAGGEVPAGVRLTAWVTGRVQGVGFRWWVRSNALELGLTGFAENLEDGRVKVVAEGAEAGCQELLARLEDGVGDAQAACRGRLARPGRVSQVTHRWAQAVGGFPGFTER